MAEERILAVRFESADEFQREYEANMANGGVFVPTLESVELRSRVCIGIEFGYRPEVLMLAGEVVHAVPPELAPAGATPGVAVQFDLAGQALREKVEPLLAVDEPQASGTEAAGAENTPAEAERREALRGTARVPVLLRLGQDHLLDGRTRNLSSTGLLFAIEGVALERKDVKKGLEATLFIKHPGTFEDMIIPGKVGRRMCDESGAVRAIGVRFAPVQSLPTEVKHFLENLQQSEHTKNLGGIKGEVDGGGCAPLLERFAKASPEGTLILSRGAEEGWITVRDGCWLGARLGSAAGRKALVRLLGWESGRYEFLGRIEEAREGSAETPMPIEAVVLDAAREVDELRHLRTERFPADRKLVPVPEALAAFALDKLESAVVDLSSVGQPIGRLVEVIPEPDLAVYHAIEGLLESGVVRIEDA